MASPLRPYWALTHPAFRRCRGRRLLTLARGAHRARVLGSRRLRPKKKRRLPAAGDARAARRADAPRGRENIAQDRIAHALDEERPARRAGRVLEGPDAPRQVSRVEVAEPLTHPELGTASERRRRRPPAAGQLVVGV